MNRDSTPFARLDDLRQPRTGIPEIVWGENKTCAQLESIVRRMTEKQSLILVSRIDEKKGRRLEKEFPDGNYHPESRLFFIRSRLKEEIKTRGTILVLAA